IVPGMDGFTGVWFALVGLFIESSARHSWAQVGVFELLRRRDASSVMQTVLAKTAADSSMLETVHRYYDARSGLCAFAVDGDERVIGMVSDVQAQAVP